MVANRFHGLDFCRAVFMCLGLFFHCGLIYGAGQDWRVLSDETLTLIKYIANFIHHFRMEAFYLVSGFFYFLVYSKGREAFMKDRIYRALLPMLTVGLTINFLMNGLSYNREYYWDIDYFLSGLWLGHLWFLGNLIVYFLITKGVCQYISTRSNNISQIQFLWLIFMLLMLALTGHILAKQFSLSTVVFINFGYLFYFYPFFLMGVLSCAAKPHFYQLIKIRLFPIYLVIYAGLQATAKIDIGLSDTHVDLLKMISHLPLMLAAFAILNSIGDRESKLIRYVSEASYTIYLLHQPLIIVLYVAFFESIQLGALVEYVMLITSVLGVSLLFHHYIVCKSHILELLLNGVDRKQNKPTLRVAINTR